MARLSSLHVLLLLLVGYLAIAGWFAAFGADSYNMVWAFDCDEAGVLEDLIVMFRDRSYAPLNYIYGTLHEYLALSAMLLLGSLRRVSEQDGILILRAINTLAGAGTFYLLYRAAAAVARPWAGIVAIVLLLAARGFLLFTMNGKPELLQIVFVVLTLSLLWRAAIGGRQRWLALAGMAAGLAFTAKFAGLMLLPLALLVPFVAVEPLPLRQRLTRAVLGLAAMVAGFGIAIAVSSPYMVRDAATIVKRLAVASAVNRGGFLFAAGSNFGEWLQILFSPSLLGITGVLGLALLFYGLCRRGALPLSGEERALLAIHGAWSILFCLYLFASVNFRPERFILPAVPSLALLIGFGIVRGRALLPRTHAAQAVFAAILLGSLVPNLIDAAELLASLRHRPQASRVTAGVWLQEHLPPTTIIASDFLTYVPPGFSRQVRTSLLTSRDIMLANPDIIVIGKESSSWFQDPGKAKTFTEGEGAYMLHYLLYHGLAAGTFPGYTKLKDFDEVTVYRRTTPLDSSAGR